MRSNQPSASPTDDSISAAAAPSAANFNQSPVQISLEQDNLSPQTSSRVSLNEESSAHIRRAAAEAEAKAQAQNDETTVQIYEPAKKEPSTKEKVVALAAKHPQATTWLALIMLALIADLAMRASSAAESDGDSVNRDARKAMDALLKQSPFVTTLMFYVPAIYGAAKMMHDMGKAAFVIYTFIGDACKINPSDENHTENASLIGDSSSNADSLTTYQAINP